jgi:hypothetical protein
MAEFTNLPPEIRLAIHKRLPQVIFWDRESRALAEVVFHDWTKTIRPLLYADRLEVPGRLMREFGQSFRQCYYFIRRYDPLFTNLIPLDVLTAPGSKKKTAKLKTKISAQPDGEIIFGSGFHYKRDEAGQIWVKTTSVSNWTERGVWLPADPALDFNVTFMGHGEDTICRIDDLRKYAGDLAYPSGKRSGWERRLYTPVGKFVESLTTWPRSHGWIGIYPVNPH